MSRISDKFTYNFSEGSIYDFKDKESCLTKHIRYMLNRTQSMFKYSGLPDSIPERILELYLQMNGDVCIYKYNDTLYAFTGGLGGTPDVYYMPTIYTIANPALKLSKNLEIDKECVVIPNDSMYMGLLPLFERYATLMMENELSIKIATINSRIISLISAGDDNTKKSAMKYLEDVEKGQSGIIAENAFLDGVKSQPYGQNTTNNLTNLIELEQYLKASWYNEIGLNANYNMKRESINSGESVLNDDMLLPLIDNMLECRRIGLEKVNAMYDTNITVELSSSWEDNQQEIDLEHNNIDESKKGDATTDDGNNPTE